MTQLTEKKVIEIIKEEWGRKKLWLEKSLVNFTKADVARDGKKGVVSIDTKVRHKGSRLLYTVHEVSPEEIVLRTPEGKLFSIDDAEMSAEYELD